MRSQAHTHSTVEVRVGVSQGPVAEGNCVVARRGGEQPEANWRSAGDELDSAWNDDELAGLWRSLEHIGHAVLACKAMTGSSAWLEVERWDVCVSEARRPVGRGVVGRSQSPGSTVSAMWWWGRVAGTSRRVWRAAPLPESNWIVRESRGHHKPRVGKRDRCGGGGRYLMTENASEVAGVAEPSPHFSHPLASTVAGRCFLRWLKIVRPHRRQNGAWCSISAHFGAGCRGFSC